VSKARILFISGGGNGLCQLACAHAARLNIGDVDVLCAVTDGEPLAPEAKKAIDAVAKMEGGRVKLADLKSDDIDVAIVVSGKLAPQEALLPGHPEIVMWNVEEPSGSAASFSQVSGVIASLVSDFVSRGYMDALVDAKFCENLVLDNVHDGIIAHDMRRRIFYFNRSAEEMTGYSRAEVLNKDCHEVFPGSFCGGKCLFCDGEVPRNLDRSVRELEIYSKAGERKTMEMTVKALLDSSSEMRGVISTFRDITREKRLARRAREIENFAGIIGRTPAILEVFETIKDLADVDAPVLLQGESGTGKELVAAAIHNEGVRAGKLFVPVNCGALPENLLESELFGHVKGSFTGAIRDKKGRFELADGGTIFLDEIGDVSPAMQVKLLRVLQEGRFERVGSEKTIQVNVRLISATNKNLATEIAEGRFREDLFYRLSVVPVTLPPLRDRVNDIPLLVEHFLSRMRKDLSRPDIKVSPDAMDILMTYEWPGNIRELQNWIQFALIKCRGSEILPVHLPPGQNAVPFERLASLSGGMRGARRRRKKLDADTVKQMLLATGSNKLEAARKLGVSRATLYRFLDANPWIAG
jgi:PAS domain S-box-containing protein